MYALRSTCILHVVWHHPSKIFYVLLCVLWLVTVIATVASDVTDVWKCDLVTLTLTLSSKNRKMKNKLKWKWKWKMKMKINRVYCFQLWHYPSFKVSPPEKLTSIFASSSLTSLDILFQTFHHSTYIISLLYIFLVTSLL